MFWDDVLPELVFALRCLVHSAHGYTPFEIVFKQQPTLSVFNLPLPWDDSTLSDAEVEQVVSYLHSVWTMQLPNV